VTIEPGATMVGNTDN